MSVKYRIRLQNERIIGPFTIDEIKELYLKSHISGDEYCQQFPIGDWKNISSFPALHSLLEDLKKETSKDSTNSGLKSFKEFKFEKNFNNPVDYEELEKKYKTEVSSEKTNESEEHEDKTRIVKNSKMTSDKDIDKTVVVKSKAMAPIKETDTRAPKTIPKEIESMDEFSIDNQSISKDQLVDEKTEFFNLGQHLPSINAQLSMSEVELDHQARVEENNERIRLKQTKAHLISAEGHEDDSTEEFLEDGTKKKRKKGMSVIFAIIFSVLFYVYLYQDEKPKASGPLYLEVLFPISEEYEDSAAAAVALDQGRKLYAKNSYVQKALASKSFIISLQKKFTNNEALGELVLTYSELLDDTKDSKLAANTIYKLIQLSENKMLSDLNIVTGAALFYEKIGKHQTGINVIKNYFRAKGPASSKLLSYYLDLLINSGDLVEARKTFEKLKATPKKPVEAYISLAHFNEIDEQLGEARSLIDEGLKYYPESTLLLLKQADYLLKDSSQKKFEEVLLKINSKNSESSPVFTAKFYSYMGLLSALKKKNTEAVNYFKKSLEIKESEELRSMLSSLEIGGDQFAQSLILESKVLDLIKKSQMELKNKNLEAAFSYSIEAVDADPENIPAILLQTELQIKRGLFDSAIISLQKAIDKNPTNNILKKNLILTYMKAYKFDEAQKLLVELSQTKYAFGSEYPSLMGDFYSGKGNTLLGIRWYSEALSRDPLSDNNMYKIAKIFLNLKKFNDSKNKLAKALLLDPKNPDYLSANAEILFEQDNTDTAIGYLRDAISEIGEDPKLISSIATLYYRSGQSKEFLKYLKQIQEMPKKDETFYEFLIYASRLEEKNDDYINYSRELLKLNPGNLKARLELGEYFFDLKRYPEAIQEFEEIRSRLASYPKVHYMLAKIFLATSDIKKAKEMARKELELNPGQDTAHFIVGEVARIEQDYKEAILKFEKAISINPKSVDALMAMGWIRLAQNYSNEAIELYTRALREDKINPEIHKQLGLAHKAAGHRALAREKLEDYLKLSPVAADREQIEAQIKSLQ